ncbi:subunit of tubulin prefoldin [Xylographa parallela]|nr:subunit of tubulin prefoldin [Xylographa parallela]
MTTTPEAQAHTVDLASLSLQQLSSVKKRLDDELEHLTTSFTKLRAAQTKFRECLSSIREGISSKTKGKPVLVPLTTSLYVPGTLADAENVIVDRTKDALRFYGSKVEELGKNLKDLESIVQDKSNNLRIVENVLRQKVTTSSGDATSTLSS